jgi:glutamate-1-semialdehyde 2,1-aminomutase
LGRAAADTGCQVVVQSACGLVTAFFTGSLVRSYEEASSCDVGAYGAWCRALLARGVYPPPSQFEAWFPSLAHSDEDVTLTLAAAREAFAEVVSEA